MFKENIPIEILNGDVDFNSQQIFLSYLNNEYLKEFGLKLQNFDYCLGEENSYGNLNIISLIHEFDGVFDHFVAHGDGGGNPCYFFYMRDENLEDFYKKLYQTEDLSFIF